MGGNLLRDRGFFFVSEMCFFHTHLVKKGAQRSRRYEVRRKQVNKKISPVEHTAPNLTQEYLDAL